MKPKVRDLNLIPDTYSPERGNINVQSKIQTKIQKHEL